MTTSHSPTTPPATPPDTPPGPPCPWWGLPLLREMQRDYLGFATALQRAHGDVVALHIAHERSWDLFHPDDVRCALVEHADHLRRWERGVEVFERTFGQGLLVAEGDTWQRQRRMLAPGFLPRRVQGQAALMVEAARAALDAALPAGVDAVERPMDQLFNALTMDVILRTLFSSRAPALASAAAEATQQLSQAAMREMFRPFSLPAVLRDHLPLPPLRTERRSRRLLAGLIDAQISARLALPASVAPRDDLLAMLLAARDDAGHGLSPAELHDQCLVMFQAGHETTATALIWWSWLIASHPAVAQRAQQEVDRQLQGRDPTAADLPALPFLGATLKEALRLYPPVAALMTRRVQRPFRLAGRSVPAGTLLRITPWVIQRDARWFAEPETFRPERFLDDAAAPPRSAWLPFGVGPRVCIGQHFALLELTLVAALLLQRCTLHTVPGAPPPQPRMLVTLRPAEPLHLRLQRRLVTMPPRPRAHA